MGLTILEMRTIQKTELAREMKLMAPIRHEAQNLYQEADLPALATKMLEMLDLQRAREM